MQTIRLLAIIATACALAGCPEETTSDTGRDGSGAGASGSGMCQAPASCEHFADNIGRSCPDQAPDRDNDIEVCERLRGELEPIGCGAAIAAWVQCASTTKYDCNDFPECEAERNAYGQCQSMFTRATACSRTGSRDDECGNGYAVQCLGDPPSGCMPSATPRLFCCPHPAELESCFVD
jgi:hypothetical protein